MKKQLVTALGLALGLTFAATAYAGQIIKPTKTYTCGEEVLCVKTPKGEVYLPSIFWENEFLNPIDQAIKSRKCVNIVDKTVKDEYGTGKWPLKMTVVNCPKTLKKAYGYN